MASAKMISASGHPTRGKTSQNRLRRADNFLLTYDPSLICRQDGPFAQALFVDLGYGPIPLLRWRVPIAFTNSIQLSQLWGLKLIQSAWRMPHKTWQPEALVFSTNFRAGFDPAEFQTILPKNFIHRMIPGEAIYDFFQAWKQAAAETRPLAVWGLRQWFIAAAEKLATQGYRINLRRKWLARGYLIWRQG